MDGSDLRTFMATDHRRLVGGFSMIAGSWAAAEDAVEEAVARAWERSRDGEPIHDMAVWVAVVARNILRSGFRRTLVERRARVRILAEGASEEVDRHAERG